MFRTLNKLFRKSDAPPKDEETRAASVRPFDQPENCACFTTTHVLVDEQDIIFVHHGLDNFWQFHCSGEKKMADAMIVSLRQIVAHDSSVLEVADIPPGWEATRTHRGAAWQRRKSDE
jgi:hypothetical protein